MCIEHRGYFIQQSSYNNHIESGNVADIWQDVEG